jgi:hypothetical protein
LIRILKLAVNSSNANSPRKKLVNLLVCGNSNGLPASIFGITVSLEHAVRGDRKIMVVRQEVLLLMELAALSLLFPCSSLRKNLAK